MYMYMYMSIHVQCTCTCTCTCMCTHTIHVHVHIYILCLLYMYYTIIEFVPCIDQLFDESLLIGTGWTTRETVRSLAYSILADLVHHIRASLSLPQLSQAVHLFSKNVHDDTFPISIQTMSCKVSGIMYKYL